MRQLPRMKRIIPMGIILSLLLLAGCAKAPETVPTNDKLVIGSLPIEDNLAILVAQQKGYFAEEKVELELIPFQSPVESQSAFQAGQLDGMVTDMMIAALLKGSGEKLKVTTLTLGSTPEEGRFALIASPDSKIQTVADLKGKSIGISSNSIIEYVTDGLLRQAGVSPTEVEKVVVAKIPVRLEMLLNNQLDAIVVPDPHITYTVSKGAKVITEDTKEENLSQAVVIMTDEALTEKKEVITRFFRAYSKGVAEVNSNPAQYKNLLVENASIPAAIADQYQIQHYPAPQLPQQQEVDKVLAWLKEKDLLKTPVTYEDFVQKGLYP